MIRIRAREKNDEIQAQNRKSYNKRKEATRYRQGYIVAIKRTGPGLKLYPKFLGPDRLIRVYGMIDT